MGRGPRVSFYCSPIDAADGIAFRYAQALGRIQQIQNFGANSIHCRRVTHGQFILATFLHTLQATLSNTVLIRSLQCSILSVWLTLTQAGFTPASQSDLASPHVHRIVRASGRNASRNHRRGRPMYSIRIAIGNSVSQFAVGISGVGLP